MSLSFNIAIDGYSSCGKSTIAKGIASRYDMRYIDTGAMYRAITLYCMRNNIIKKKKIDYSRLCSELDAICIDFIFNIEEKRSETILNGENVEKIIRSFEVSENVSVIAQIQQVREKLVSLQRKIGEEKNVVMDGRDIGTKVFPNAKLKLFITSNVELRAQRRYKELIQKEEVITYREVLEHLIERDKNDTTRDINPLIQAKDAILFDNSNLSIQEQDLLIDDLIKEIL